MATMHSRLPILLLFGLGLLGFRLHGQEPEEGRVIRVSVDGDSPQQLPLEKVGLTSSSADSRDSQWG